MKKVDMPISACCEKPIFERPYIRVQDDKRDGRQHSIPTGSVERYCSQCGRRCNAWKTIKVKVPQTPRSSRGGDPGPTLEEFIEADKRREANDRLHDMQDDAHLMAEYDEHCELTEE
jgi:hypothetical protein